MIDLAGKRAVGDRAFRGATAVAAALVLLILGLIAITMTRRAVPVFQQMGLRFFTTGRWSPPENLSQSPWCMDMEPNAVAAPDGGLWVTWITNRGGRRPQC